jgi:hypothetical protein
MSALRTCIPGANPPSAERRRQGSGQEIDEVLGASEPLQAQLIFSFFDF